MKKEQVEKYLARIKREVSELEERSYSPFSKEILNGAIVIEICLHTNPLDFEQSEVVLIDEIDDGVLSAHLDWDRDENDHDRVVGVDCLTLFSLEVIWKISYQY